MVRRWNFVAALVVATLSVIHCEQMNFHQNRNNTRGDLCPCLPVDICPRVFGTEPDDVKYFGDIKKCDDVNSVRCCGASSSIVIGTTQAPNTELPKTQVPEPDILSRIAEDDVHENEIPEVESESELLTSTISERDENTETPTGNIANFQHKQHSNGDFDEEAAGSESIAKTSKADIQQSFDRNDKLNNEDFSQENNISNLNRKWKNLNNVLTVYPNVMSGIPKTTPKNMPDTNEMKMFDKEIGVDLHLVFSQTTIKTEVPVEVEPSSTISPTNKPSFNRFTKRRRKYKTIPKPTTESPVEDMGLTTTTARSRLVVRPSSRVRHFNRSSSQDSTNSLPRTNLTMTVPIAQDEEILQTTDDDQSQKNRFRLFNARNRLNYLRRSTATTTTQPTTLVEVTTRRTAPKKPNRRPPVVNENPFRGGPLNINETLARLMDANHRNVMTKVRIALKAAASENEIVDIPRSFAGADMNNRVKQIEKVLANKMIDFITETKTRRRGHSIRKKDKVPNSLPVTETPILEQTSNPTRPNRGEKKFELSDLHEETLIVPMSYSEFKRMRASAITQIHVGKLEDEVPVSTTRRSRRRHTTTIRPNESKENKEIPKFRRRVNKRRRFTSKSSSTTFSPAVLSTTETISVKPTSESTATATMAAPIILNEAQEGELSTKLPIDSQNEPQSVDVEDTSSPLNKENYEKNLSDFKPSPLWSITNGDEQDFYGKEQNSPNVLDEQALENTLLRNHRQSRNIFEPPVQYFNGFIPASPLIAPVEIIGPIPKSDKARQDTIVIHKARISKN